MSGIIERLKRRKLAQWGFGYLAGSFVVLQLMDVVAEPLGLSILVQRSVLFLLAVGFLLVLVLAWHHGERGRQRLVGSEILTIAGLLVIAGGGLLAIGRGIADEVPDTVAAVDGGQTLAVLPLANLSSDPEQQYFAAGLTAAIHSKLATLDDLQLAPRTSALRFAGTERHVREIAAELGVRYLLTGGVFKANDRVRIDVQVSDATSGFDIWAEQFSGTLDDILAFQAQTALQIAESLGLELTAEQVAAVRDRYTENVEAYDAYLRGWTLLESFHVRSDVPTDRLEAAREHFERAIELDDEFAPAIAGLSMVEGYYILHGVDRSEERHERSMALARRALEIDPGLPEAVAALADAYNLEGETERAIETYQEAVRLDPDNAIAWCHLAYACNRSGDLETAERAARRAILLFPTYYYSHVQLGHALMAQQRWDEAIVAYEDAVRLNPDAWTPYDRIATMHREREDWEAALAVYERALERFDSVRLLIEVALVTAAAGQEERAAAALERAFENGASVSEVETNELAEHVLEDEALSAVVDRYR